MIYEHLLICDAQFVPPLSQRVELSAYSAKLATNAVSFEFWSRDKLVGLVAGYADAPDRQSSFITNVSVLPDWNGQGIAGDLIDAFVKHVGKAGFARVVLIVDMENYAARSLYLKNGFVNGTSEGTNLQMFLSLREFS